MRSCQFFDYILSTDISSNNLLEMCGSRSEFPFWSPVDCLHPPFDAMILLSGRDFLCVQSMDGTLTVFEQESFSFTRFLPGALLPGPVAYLSRTDSFITVSSSRQVECYK